MAYRFPAPRLRLLIAAGLGLAATLGPAAHALVAAELLTPELQRVEIHLAGLRDGQLNFFDQNRRLRQQPAAAFVRLILRPRDPEPARPDANQITTTTPTIDTPAEPPADPPAMRIELVDGQRYLGRWLGSANQGEAIVFQHDRLGQMTLPLDRLRRLTRLDTPADPALASDPATAAADRAVMINGDQLEGFVVGLEPAGLTLLLDGAAEPLTLPADRLASLTLANPLDAAANQGDLITLRDGSRARIDGLSIRGDDVAFVPRLVDDLAPVELPLSQVTQIDFTASGLRLIELADQPRRVTAGGEAFGLPLPPVVDAGQLRLHSPITLELDLPEGARRFAAEAELDLPADLPEDRRRFADLVLSVDEANTPDADTAPDVTRSPPARRFHLHADQPAASINLPLPAGQTTLTLRVDPAANGPVLDRLRLRDAVLLIDAPTPRPGSTDTDLP